MVATSMVGVDLVWLYGISTIEGYSMPNPVYTYILDIYDCKHKSTKLNNSKGSMY